MVTTGARTTRRAEGCVGVNVDVGLGVGVGVGLGLGLGLGAAKTRRFLSRILGLTGTGFLVVREVPRAEVVLVVFALALRAGLGAEAEDLATFLIFFMA